MNLKRLILLFMLVGSVVLFGCETNNEQLISEEPIVEEAIQDDANIDVVTEEIDILLAPLTPEEELRLQELMTRGSEWGLDFGMDEDVAREIIIYSRLTIPLDYHLSEEEATEIVLRLIYETFGVVINVEDIHRPYYIPSEIFFGMDFRHEQWSSDGRSFWIGNATIYNVPYGEHQSLLHRISFRIDGITGEKDILRDWVQDELAFEPSITEISWNGMQLIALDERRGPSIWDDPSFSTRIQPHHPSIEEIGIIIAEAVYDELSVNLDGHFMLMFMEHFTEYTMWFVEVTTENDICTSIALVHVNAQTGEILFIGESAHSGDNPFSGCYLGVR